jgi:hypothetical protein
MSDDQKSWANRPLYATWPGRLIFVLALALPDVAKTLYPEWIDPKVRVIWYALLLVLVGGSWWWSHHKK